MIRIPKAKLTNRFNIITVYMLVFVCCWLNAASQNTEPNQYGLTVIKNISTFQSIIEKSPSKRMVDLQKTIPSIAFDLRYASTNNFLHKKIYPTLNTSFLRADAEEVLKKVQAELNLKGLGLKIFDAYRPYTATEMMWELVKDDRYTADPKKGSGHNRGIAVDLTIIYLKTKKELAMGTGFDNFTDSAHHDFKALDADVLQNRLLLKNIMEKYGFKALETEWWHYALPNSNDYELLDLSFNDLKKLSKKQRR